MINSLTNSPKEIIIIKADVDYIRQNIDEIKNIIKDQCVPRYELISIISEIRVLQENSVTQDQFWPVKMVVFGFVGLVLTTTVLALLTLLAVDRAP